mgnify:CR=1 FL=1
MMNDTPEAALRSRIADLEQQLKLADEGLSLIHISEPTRH